MLTQHKALPSTRPPLPSPRRFSRLSQVRASSDRTRHISLARLTHPLGWCTEGAKIVEICQKGDKLLDEEIAKVYKGKSISKGISHPCTVSPSTFITPYTPLVSDAEEAETTLKAGEPVKIQLGAQVDGFGTIVCDTIVVGGEATGRTADLQLATYYAQ
jgi:methionine aminopeptidase